MASFSAYLEVGGSRYPLTYYDLYIHQQTDTLGRPASLTQGGTITCELHSPDQRDNVLTEWMLSPTKQHDGFVHLYREDTKAKLKTIAFFNAYCVDMGVHFSASGLGPMMTRIVISPQRVAVGAIVHDNDWPVESHGAGITYANVPKRPSATNQENAFAIIPASYIPPVVATTVASGCTPGEQMRLQQEVTLHCKTVPTKCFNTDSCPVLEGKMETINACISARTKINMKCFKGGDAGHKQAIEEKINSLVKCQGIFFQLCGAKQKPVPQPVPVPIPQSDPDFMKKMEALTGLTGAALIIYLIISEGSRLFPPRNLIPVP